MSSSPAPVEPPWRARFAVIWSGQQLSAAGSAVASFALIWWVTRTTGSATVLATATLATLLPRVLLGSFAGALVDRWNRRAILIVADSAIALVSAWLLALFWADAVQVWHLYVVMLLRALGGLFHSPAISASTTLLVPERHYARVAGLNQMMSGALGVLGPMAGALLLSVWPLWGIMALDVVTAACAVGPLLFTSVPQPAKAALVAREPLWRTFTAGLRYIVAWRGLRALLLVALGLNFFGYPAMALLPLLVTRHFNGGPLQLGWLNAASGLGLALGGLALGLWGGFRRRIITMMVGVAGLSVAQAVVGLTPANALPLAVVATFAGAVLGSWTEGASSALLQSVVPHELQGRVFATADSLSSIASPLAMALAGPLADAIDLCWLYVLPGMASLAMALVALRTPAIMHLEESRPPLYPQEGPP